MRCSTVYPATHNTVQYSIPHDKYPNYSDPRLETYWALLLCAAKDRGGGCTPESTLASFLRSGLHDCRAVMRNVFLVFLHFTNRLCVVCPIGFPSSACMQRVRTPQLTQLPRSTLRPGPCYGAIAATQPMLWSHRQIPAPQLAHNNNDNNPRFTGGKAPCAPPIAVVLHLGAVCITPPCRSGPRQSSCPNRSGLSATGLQEHIISHDSNQFAHDSQWFTMPVRKSTPGY